MWITVRALAVVAGLMLSGAPAAATPHATGTPHATLAVSYNFLDGARSELANPGGSLPGTNNFSCRPGREHPRPVILVHGAGGGRQTNWATLAPVLTNAGYCVFALTYGALAPLWPASALGGLGDKRSSAWEIKRFADTVLAATGVRQVDIVGHSLGTEIPTYWLKYLGGRDKVAAYVSLAPFWDQGPDSGDARNATIARFQKLLGIPGPVPDTRCAGCVNPPRGSDFNRAVRAPSPYLPGIRYTNIVTRFDEIVVPYTVGLLAGPPGTNVRNIVVQKGCAADHSDHLSITSNRRSAALVLAALDPAHPPTIPCVPVAPVTGG